VGERGDQRSRHHERQAQADGAIAEEAPRTFALEARPDKNSRDEKHQRHKEDVVEADQPREAVPARGVDHRECGPDARLVEERSRKGRGERVIRQRGMMGHDRQGEEGAQIAHRYAIAGAGCG